MNDRAPPMKPTPTPEQIAAFYKAHDEALELQPRENHQAVFAGLSAALSVPAEAVVGEPVAWRWSFDGGDTWNYGTLKPGKMRFGDPDIIEPLYASPPALGGSHD